MHPTNFQIVANIVDADLRTVTPSKLTIKDGIIASIESVEGMQGTFLIPGFVDAHVHIESSMLVPAEFARAAVVHGTVGTVSDPHEIANVLGEKGIEFMLENAADVPFKFCFGAPSCVPATEFETAGASIDSEQVARLMADPRIGYLSEVMNFPGVLSRAPDLMAKLESAKYHGKPIDGHAPGLRGDQAKAYFEVGITTDHECVTKAEALDKLAVGCKIAIREGSAARNFDALVSLIDEFPDQVMLCSDDKHPNELIQGHINELAARAVALGMDPFHVIKASSINAIRHYGMPIGLLREGDRADFIEVKDLASWQVLRTFVDGQLVAENGKSHIQTSKHEVLNRFDANLCTEEKLQVVAHGEQVLAIGARDGQLVTQKRLMRAKNSDGLAVCDTDADLLKLVVVNRYTKADPVVAFVHGFGLKRGAFASSVAHDSHNVIAVGADDSSLCRAINSIIRMQGGLSVTDGENELELSLPVAGLMSTDPVELVSDRYIDLDKAVKRMGSELRAPFMTLSFMALLVIPELKLSDLGLFDGAQFKFTELFS